MDQSGLNPTPEKFTPQSESELPQDKSDAVASALLRSGAYSLLGGTLHGAYADPSTNHGLPNLISYRKNVLKGSKLSDHAVGELFDGKHIDFEHDEKDQEKLHKYLEDGKFNEQLAEAQSKPQAFAKGGVVKSAFSGSEPMEQGLPDHNLLLQAAKSRINGYLNNLRPVQDFSGLSFDSQPHMKTKEKAYRNALDLANKPMNILGHVSRGTLTADELSHFKGLYPEVYDNLSKKMTQKIINSRLENKKPSYKVRQSLSLFLGAPLDSTMTPQSVQAAQAVFSGMRPEPQAPQKKASKKSANLSGEAKSYLTPDQAALSREQRAK